MKKLKKRGFMIHSLAGGKLRDKIIVDLVKVEFEDRQGEYFWYISELKNLEKNDFVLAPFGILDEPKKAKVLDIKNDVKSDASPIRLKNAKKLYKKL